MDSSRKIEALRLRQGLSRSALARRASLDRATVAAAENGKKVSALTKAKIATALGVEVEEIDEGA